MDRDHNVCDTPMLAPNAQRRGRESGRLQHPPVELDPRRRAVVQRAIVQVAEHRGCTIHALNVRSNHLHVVVTADDTPERVMTAFKSWSTRRMTEAGLLPRGAKPWVRHGSTRYLWKVESLDAACRYVCEGQGEDLHPGEATDA